MDLELAQLTINNVQTVRANLKIAQDRQRSYANLKRADIEFNVGDKVFLKISPWKGVIRFGRRGKLSPRFIGPYEVIERIGLVTYQLALPPILERVHNIFHVSILRKYRSNPTHILKEQPVELEKNLSYEEAPIAILAREQKVLRNKVIPLVKVLWKNHSQ